MSRSLKKSGLNRMLSVITAFAMTFSTASALIVSSAAEDDINSSVTQLDSSTGLPVMGLEVHPVATSQDSSGNNASLNWAVDGVEDEDGLSFAVYKSVDGQAFKKCYVTDGTSWQDYELSDEYTYKYKVVALNSDETAVAVSNEAEFTPITQTSDMKVHSNVTGGELEYETSGTKIGDTYYSYSMKSNSGSYYLVESTSSDGVNFGNQRTVADESQNSDLGSCKLESVQMKYVESKNIMMIWAHWELPSGYDSGKALVITGTPGGTFTVHNIYNPLGVYVRDMSIFVDDDDTGYLVAASNESGQGANATIYIFKMNDTYSDVTEVVKKLHENQYREFPCLIKRDGYYYLFTSQAAGWYPSKGGYTSTKSLSGEWSDLRSIGDSSTFSSQSGWIQSIGNGENCVMHAYRWISSSDTAGSTLCPVYFANGFAFYDYCTSFKYDMKNSLLLPVQDGELLSLNKPVTSSISSSTLQNAVDGSYENAFVGDEKTWPFTIQIDLLKECNLSDIQISWYICKGSEGYYTYYVEGSTDGENWTTLLDRTDESSERVTKTYGFTNDALSGYARYVRLTVTNAHLHNNTNNWYTPKIYEIKVFGEPADSSSQTKTETQPIAAYHLDQSEISGGKISDKTGNNDDLVLYGDYGTNSTADTLDSSEHSAYIGDSSQPVYFSGSSGCYAQLPDGLLSSTDEFSISIRARSDTTFTDPYFTLGIGNDSTQYLIFKLGKDKVRFNISNNSWMGETGIKTDADGENWHTYTITVDETTAKLYIDKELVGENYQMGALLTNFGNSTKLYLGKSFYSSDQYFKGSISSICFYDFALSEENISEMKNTVYYTGDAPEVDPDPVDEETVLWTGSTSVGNWESCVDITTSMISEFKENDVIKVEFTVDSSSAQFQAQTGNWNSIAFDNCDSWGGADVSSSDSPFCLSITADIADQINNDTSDGVILRVKGKYITITKVTLVRETESTSGLTPNTVYKQTTSVSNGYYNVRFIQMVKKTDLENVTSITYTITDGTNTKTITGSSCFTTVTASGSAITADNGYVFIGVIITGIPESSTLTCSMSY